MSHLSELVLFRSISGISINNKYISNYFKKYKLLRKCVFLTNKRIMLSRHPSSKERQPGRCRQTGLLFKYDLPASCSGVAEVQWTYRTIYCLCVSGPRFGALSLGHEDVVDGFQISLTLGWRSRISLETQRAVGQQHPILAHPRSAIIYLLLKCTVWSNGRKS